MCVATSSIVIFDLPSNIYKNMIRFWLEHIISVADVRTILRRNRPPRTMTNSKRIVYFVSAFMSKRCQFTGIFTIISIILVCCSIMF